MPRKRKIESELKTDIAAKKANLNDGENRDKFAIDRFLHELEWRSLLESEFKSDYFLNLNSFLENEYKRKSIKPPQELVFNAFNLTKLSQIKCVILGQDPYHDEEQAHGLAFSVPAGVKIPRSLANIFKELETDLPDFERDESLGGCLEKWAKQGVFLLNVFLTVELHKPGSHAKSGWHVFTDRVIRLISEKNAGCVFLLWGKFAEAKATLIDETKHCVIKAAHPSPMSFHLFAKSRCFSRTNEYLKTVGKQPINWSLK